MPEITSPFSLKDCFTALWHITESLEELKLLWGEDTLPLRKATNTKYAQFLSSRILLQRHLEVDNVLYNDDGKPEIAGLKSVSISHSGEFVLIASSEHYEIGVDIQTYPRYALKKALHFYLSTKEQEILTDEIDLKKLHVYWSVKEAVF